MKFTIARDRLLKALQLATGVVERRQTLPVLANLLIRADENGVALTGTDLEVEMVAHTNVDVEQSREITIPARKLADIWRALRDGADVSISAEGDRSTGKRRSLPVEEIERTADLDRTVRGRSSAVAAASAGPPPPTPQPKASYMMK